MREKPNYLKEAAAHPWNRAALLAAAVASVVGLWQGTPWVLVACLAAEALYLLIVPLLPAFRRACDQEVEKKRARCRAVELEQIAARLSPNAKSRLDGIVRAREKILDSLRSLAEARSLEQQWTGRLDALVASALRILVAVDASRADERDRRFHQSEVKQLRAEVAGLPEESAARAAKAQRLELAEKRLAAFAKLQDGREAAIAQLETVEDILQDLLAQGLAGRDAGAFAGRIDALAAQIAAAGESVAELDRHAETEAELAALKTSG